MQGNIVSAARWLGLSIVLASCILVLGLRGLLTDLHPGASPALPAVTVAQGTGEEQADPGPVTAPMTEEEARKTVASILEWLANGGLRLGFPQDDPNERMMKLLHQSEDLAQVEKEWERFWAMDGGKEQVATQVNAPIKGPTDD